MTVSQHHHPSDDQPSLVHMWLHMSDLGPVRCHTASDDSLELTIDQPDDSCDMEEWGQIIVGPAPEGFPMRPFVGRLVREVHRIIYRRIETEVGLRLGFDCGDVRILNLGDELVVTDAALPDALEAELH